MRKNLLLLFAFMFIGLSAATAQDAKAIKKALRSATKAYSKYKLDASNADKLQTAKDAISSVLAMPGADTNPKVWSTKADIFNLVAQTEVAAKDKLDVEAQLKGEAAAPFAFTDLAAPVTAFEAYSKALSLSTKSSEKTSIVKSLESNSQLLNNMGITAFQNKKYKEAYKIFNSLISGHELISSNGGKTLLDTNEKVEDYTLYAAYSAQTAGQEDEAMTLFHKLADNDSKNVGVYDALFKAYLEKDEAKAKSYLEKGRKINPEDPGLLFSEINYYLKKGEYKVLETKLQQAIEKEPNNASVRSVMGNVYNKLQQEESDPTKKEEYFSKAEDYFNQALEIDGANFDAIYSLGELKYNKAASLTAELNELSNDLSKAGMKKYDAVKANMDKLFDEALPYFLKAHDVSPKDMNTLIALKELYARKSDLETSGKYKAKIDALK